MLQAPSEVCDVSFPQALCKGLSLSCEDVQAVSTSQGPAIAGLTVSSFMTLTVCVWGCLGKQLGQGVYLVPLSPTTAVGPEPHCTPVPPPCKAGLGDYNTHAVCLKMHFKESPHLFFFLLYPDSGKRQKGCREKQVHQLLVKGNSLKSLSQKCTDLFCLLMKLRWLLDSPNK